MTELENPNKPKVVIDKENNAIYFSRSVIPYLRGKERTEWLKYHDYWAHVGMYGYRKDVLQEITAWHPGNLKQPSRWNSSGGSKTVTG